MNGRRYAALLIVVALFVAIPVVILAEDTSQNVERGVVVLQEDASGVVLRFTLGEYEVRDVEVSGQRYQRLLMDEMGRTLLPGVPELPVKSAMVGIPPAAEYSVHILKDSHVELPGTYRLPPVPRPALEKPWVFGPADAWSEPLAIEPGLAYEEDSSVFACDALFPKEIATVRQSGFAGNQRYLLLDLYPFQINPVTGRIVLHSDIEVEIRFSYPHEDEMLNAKVARGPFERVVESVVINPSTASAWRSRSVQPPLRNVTQAVPPETSYKVLVDEDGVYRLTRTELEAAGVPVATIDASTLKLYHDGSEAAVLVNESGGVLEDLVFFGEKERSRYTDVNVYWLTWADGSGQRMPVRDVSPGGGPQPSLTFSTTARLEEDHFYLPGIPWADEDHWWWTYTRYPSVPSAEFTTSLTGVAETPAYSGTLRAHMHGYYQYYSINPDHCVDLYLNDSRVGESVTWDGKVGKTAEFTFTSSILQEGVNTVRVEGCYTGATYDLIYHNWFEIDYQRYFTAEQDMLAFESDIAGPRFQVGEFSTDTLVGLDITEPLSVTQLVNADIVSANPGEYAVDLYDPTAGAGTRYWIQTADQYKQPLDIQAYVSPGLTEPSHQADYVVIAPTEFVTVVEPLVNHRDSAGLGTIVVELQDIFDEFNWGVYDPEAIRDFLSYAFHSWTAPAPTYVVLAGDGHFDFKNNLGHDAFNPVPPYLAFVDVHLGEMPVDNQYVAVNGGDNIPDMFIGRLPGRDIPEMRAIVSKTLDYGLDPPPGDWNTMSLFVADKDDPAAGYFADLSSDLVENHYSSPPYTYTETYMGTTCPIEYPSVVCRQEILDFFGDGGLLVHYTGHAGTWLWGKGGALLFDTAALDDIAENERLPVSFSSACSDGYFAGPPDAGLSESLTRAENKGTVASFANTGFGLSSSEHYLSIGFLDAIFQQGTCELGSATLQSRLYLDQMGAEPHLIDTYTLFGDPALCMNVPRYVFLPVVLRNAP